MPELPEVEIVKQSLKKSIKYKKIKDVIVKNRNLRFKISKKFEKILKNKFVKNVSRISKYIIIHLDTEIYCIIHLGMSGTIHLINDHNKKKQTNLSFYQSITLPKKHNHVQIIFPKFKIIYNDPRRFGFFKLICNKEKLDLYFKKIGPEPLSSKFNYKYLKNSLKNRKKNIKNLLLDQNFISGIGNIYANEILFYSKINPIRSGYKIKKNEIIKLIKYSKIVLNLAIKFGGSSIRDFKSISGSYGSFQKEFKIYGKEGENCSRKNCSGKIIKIYQSNRSTFFCKLCQI